MTEGIDIDNSYNPTANADALRTVISWAAPHILWIYFYDVFNAFQTSALNPPPPSKHHYLSPPPLYNQYFSQRQSNHSLLKSCTDWKVLVMQTLCNMQGTKDTRGLGIVSNTIYKGIFIWQQDDILSYLILYWQLMTLYSLIIPQKQYTYWKLHSILFFTSKIPRSNQRSSRITVMMIGTHIYCANMNVIYYINITV